MRHIKLVFHSTLESNPLFDILIKTLNAYDLIKTVNINLKRKTNPIVYILMRLHINFKYISTKRTLEI